MLHEIWVIVKMAILIYGIVGLFSWILCVSRSAKKNNSTVKMVRESYLKEIRLARSICKKSGIAVRIMFSPFDGTSKILNGNSTFYRTILVSYSWIEKIVLCDPKWNIAFFHMIGHELGHKMNEPRPIRWISKKAKFTNHVRECRADFFGMEFILANNLAKNRKEALEAIKQKMDYNDLVRKAKSVNDDTHPRSEFRYYLLCKYEYFGEKAIREIAQKIGYKDKRNIEELIDRASLVEKK